MVANANWWCCSQSIEKKDWFLIYQHYLIIVIRKPNSMFFRYFGQGVFGFVGIKPNVFFFLATILIMAMFNFQFWVRIKIGSWYYLTCCTSLLFSHFLMCCLTNKTALELHIVQLIVVLFLNWLTSQIWYCIISTYCIIDQICQNISFAHMWCVARFGTKHLKTVFEWLAKTSF